MDVSNNLQKITRLTRWNYGLAAAVATAVLAVTILAGLFAVRILLREQIAQRDAEALYATTLLEQLELAEMNEGEVWSDEQIGFDAAVRASKLRGVIGIRFYDTQGTFIDSFPPTIQPQPLSAVSRQAMDRHEPHAHFVSESPLTDIFIYLPEFASGQVKRVPTLEVSVPLFRADRKTRSGAAQFIVEGQSIAVEYARMDRRLGLFAAVTFAMSALLLITLLWPAFQKAENLSVELAERGERLRRANEELALAARVSAVGAVSAHLMHGLKNPLSSLSALVSRHTVSDIGGDTDDWQDALAAARRMQSLVAQTVEVLGDMRGEPVYEIAVHELAEDVRQRIAAEASTQGVNLSVHTRCAFNLTSREANLARLILVNILENAVQAAGPGGEATLTVSLDKEQLRFCVTDTGPGFPEHLLDQLFLPCKSTKEGGSGIGLAISKRIADALGASLTLQDSSPQGCVWRLDLPVPPRQE